MMGGRKSAARGWGYAVTLIVVLGLLGLFGSGAVAVEKGAKGKRPWEAVAMDESAKSKAATPTVSAPNAAEEEDEEPELDQEEEDVLQRIRTFWKPKKPKEAEFLDLPHVGVPFRTPELEYYPCMDCHEDNEINEPKIRTLTEEHTDIVLDHGGGRFWCTTCHNLENMNYFRSMKDERIDFNKPYLLCGQCHSPRQKDWFFGGHGKRIGSWRGEKVGLSCTECHYSHSPRIKPRPPDPPPKHHKEPDSFLTNVMKLSIFKSLGFADNQKGGE